MTPSTTKSWVMSGTDKGFDGLKLQDAKLPGLGENEVLVSSSTG